MILRAADSIVRQFQGEQQLQLQREQFEQVKKNQDRAFALQQAQIDLKTENSDLEQQLLKNRIDLTEAQTGLTKAKTAAAGQPSPADQEKLATSRRRTKTVGIGVGLSRAATQWQSVDQSRGGPPMSFEDREDFERQAEDALDFMGSNAAIAFPESPEALAAKRVLEFSRSAEAQTFLSQVNTGPLPPDLEQEALQIRFPGAPPERLQELDAAERAQDQTLRTSSGRRLLQGIDPAQLQAAQDSFKQNNTAGMKAILKTEILDIIGLSREKQAALYNELIQMFPADERGRARLLMLDIGNEIKAQENKQ